jgi:hypothetical protein
MVITATARTFILVLLGLSVAWVIACVIRNDMATIVRAMITMILLGVVFFYLNQTSLKTLTVKSIKNDLFPPKPLHLAYEKRDVLVGDQLQTVYAFADPGPELILSMDEGGKYLTISDIEPLNRVLQYIGLPPVKRGTHELVAVTGSNLDADKYRWDDYELGVLTIERGICRNVMTTATYPCIEKITLLRH